MEIQIHIDDISWICHICLRNFLYKTKIGVMDLKKNPLKPDYSSERGKSAA